MNRRARGALGGGASKTNVETEMGVDLKLTDVATGEIVLADAVSASVKQGSGFSVGGIQKAEASADPFADVQEVVAATDRRGRGHEPHPDQGDSGAGRRNADPQLR